MRARVHTKRLRHRSILLQRTLLTAAATLLAVAAPPLAHAHSHAAAHPFPMPDTHAQTTVPECTVDSGAASAASSAPAAVPLGSVHAVLRPSKDRGHADHGWLHTFHTFSFANYYDRQFESLHALRVLNEDRVEGGQGFGAHSHREFEIFSYVVSGALRHADSMGNQESLPRGAVQFTSAGTGITHSEYNAAPHGGELVHFLQIWVKPNTSGLKPSYKTKHFNDKAKKNKLCLLLSKDAREGSIRLHSDQDVYASLLNAGQSLSFDLRPGRDAYLHLVMDSTGMRSEANETGLTIQSASGEWTLQGGDGAFIKVPAGDASKASQRFTITGAGKDGAVAEFLLFDIKKQ